VDVYDGDTFRVQLHGSAKDLLGDTIGVRVRGVDAAELNDACATAKAEALQAKSYLAKLLTGRVVTLKNIEKDKYFRLLADVEVNGIDLAATLLEQRYTRPYRGGKRVKRCVA
jgi:endonuclease YncB( thermonuclease family)